MPQPIQQDHELICRNCGCVVGEVHEPVYQEKLTVSKSLEMSLLGTAIEKSRKYALKQHPLEYYQERITIKVYDLVKKYELPESIAVDVINELKKKKSGFRSETEYIKQLIKILSKDDNYLFIKKLRMIRTDYEDIINC